MIGSPRFGTLAAVGYDAAEKGAKPTRVLVVVVNYRTADLVVACLDSLAGQVAAIPGMRVVVVDNDSGDGSAARIEDAIRAHHRQDWASVLPLDRNEGFAAGNNAGIGPALGSDSPPDYVLLLNPDTIVREGAIAALVRFMNEHPDAGIAGSRLENPDGSVQRSAFRFPSPITEFVATFRLDVLSRRCPRLLVAPPAAEAACRTDWVSGACMMVRREVFDKVGLLDPGYFMYFEELDFCLAAHRAAVNRAGPTCWYVPESRVVHLVGQASGFSVSTRTSQRCPQWWFDSRRRFFLKNHGVLYAALADAAWIAGLATCRLQRRIRGIPDHDPQHFLADFVRNCVFVRGGRLAAPQTRPKSEGSV